MLSTEVESHMEILGLICIIKKPHSEIPVRSYHCIWITAITIDIEHETNNKRLHCLNNLLTFMITQVILQMQVFGNSFVSIKCKLRKGNDNMAKKRTSMKIAKKASKVLRDGRISKTNKSIAASALSQREKK